MTIHPNTVDQIQNLTHEIGLMSDELYQSSRFLDGKELGDKPVEDNLQEAIARASHSLDLLKLSVSYCRTAVNIAHGREIQPKE